MLCQRVIADELMDADDLDPATYSAVLADLAQVNEVTMASRPTMQFLKDATGHLTALRLLDVGFGHGDMLRRIERWARRRGIAADLVGIDLNPKSEAIARAATPADVVVDYRTGDYRSLAGENWDIIVSSLVAHHMTDEELVDFLRFMMTEARVGWLVNDLNRHGFAYVGFPLLARAMGWHDIVRHDGKLSIARSRRPDEWHALLGKAGIVDAKVRRMFPFRLSVSWRR